MIGTEMLSRINAAQPRFFGCRGERSKVTSYSRQRFRGNIKCESIAEVCSQNLRSCKADSAVSSGVGRVRRGFVRQRKPVWIRLCPGVIVLAGEANCRDRPPEIVCIFRIEETDCCIREADVQLSE